MLFVIGVLFDVLCIGLLGYFDLFVVGLGLGSYLFSWMNDCFVEYIVGVWVLSVLVWFYCVLMLVWVFWLVVILLCWVGWVWVVFSEGGVWLV